MGIVLKRAYEAPAAKDGYRVLVDRLWPRGVSKEEARLDAWLKEAAPSDELRSRFHGERAGWSEFRRRYLAELKPHREESRPLAHRAREGRVTLVYAGRDERRNNAALRHPQRSSLAASSGSRLPGFGHSAARAVAGKLVGRQGCEMHATHIPTPGDEVRLPEPAREEGRGIELAGRYPPPAARRARSSTSCTTMAAPRSAAQPRPSIAIENCS
ncbi:MAG: DUF488 family protein [Spirochaetales bacterium]|nr:DUF488 family protein [Spirochaetales bacterium]